MLSATPSRMKLPPPVRLLLPEPPVPPRLATIRSEAQLLPVVIPSEAEVQTPVATRSVAELPEATIRLATRSRTAAPERLPVH